MRSTKIANFPTPSILKRDRPVEEVFLGGWCRGGTIKRAFIFVRDAYQEGNPMSEEPKGNGAPYRLSSMFGEYDAETVERVHRENIRKSKLALEQSTNLPKPEASEESPSKKRTFTWKSSKPRRVFDSEISPYQGSGGLKQMQRAQSQKRRQVRRQEASIWDNIAPKELHGLLNFMLAVIFVLGLALVFAIR